MKYLENIALNKEKELLKEVRKHVDNPSSRYFGLASELWELVRQGLKAGTIPK